jgi:hypothetical protein
VVRSVSGAVSSILAACYAEREIPPDYSENAMSRGRIRTVTDSTPPLIPGQRMSAPPELSPEQAATWDRIIASLPQGWITPGSAPLLKELCRHIDHADRLSSDINQVQAQHRELTTAAIAPGADARIIKLSRQTRSHLFSLMRLHRLQSDAIGRLSQKLRLTKLSQYTRDAESAAIAARNGAGPRPWTDW